MEEYEKARAAEFVISNCQGIAPIYETFYLHSISHTAARCLDAFKRFEGAVESDAEADELISIAQEAIGHAAVLARFFWPFVQGSFAQDDASYQDKLKYHRANKLRDTFGLEDSSPLGDIDLRHAWEQFDECLDLYLLDTAGGFFAPRCVKGSHVGAEDCVGHAYKLVDLEAKCLFLLGKRYFYGTIRQAVEDLYTKAQLLQQSDNIQC